MDGTATESEPFEDPTDTETPESPLAIAPPILVPILHRTARMAVRVPYAMSSGLSTSMAEVEAMSESAFRKRFRSFYESSPSVSPPDLPLRKHYHGTSKLVKGSEEDDDEEDEEIAESMDSDSVSEDAEDKGPTAEDEDPAVEDEGLTAAVKGPDMDDEDYDLDDETRGMDDEGRGIDDEGHSVESDRLGLEEEEAVPGGQRQVALVVGTTVSAPLGLGYGALRRRELALWWVMYTADPEEGMIYIDIPDYTPPAPPVQTPPSPEWTSATLTTVETEGFLTKLRAQVEMQGGLIHDHVVRLEELSHTLFDRSLEYEQERVVMTFEAIWRPVLALEAWAGQNRDLWLQLAEERRARLELVEVVDGMRRRQEPRG
ncbi:hypothetical protein Tco_1511603, partial [Tanacetum coccineum]